MAYIYFDESGDLGFDFSKQGTSNHFSIAFMIIGDKRPISALVKKVFKSLPPTARLRSGGALHARYEKTSTVTKLLKALAKKDVSVATIRLNKRKLLISSNPNELYSSIVISLINRLYADDHFKGEENINLIASQRNTNKSLNTRFTECVVDKTPGGTKFNVSIVKPADDKCLQAADFISWAFWQKYEKGNNNFTDIFANKIICEHEIKYYYTHARLSEEPKGRRGNPENAYPCRSYVMLVDYRLDCFAFGSQRRWSEV